MSRPRCPTTSLSRRCARRRPCSLTVRQVDPKHLNKPLTSDTERRYLRGAENDLRVLVENQVKAVELLTKAAEDMEVRASLRALAASRVDCPALR